MLGDIPFPSPYGDCGSYLAVYTSKNVLRVSFPFPSPYGDCGSYPIKQKTNSVVKLGSFRPLTGIVVLISTLYGWRNYAMDFAFCGADFIFPLFSEFSVKRAIKNS